MSHRVTFDGFIRRIPNITSSGRIYKNVEFYLESFGRKSINVVWVKLEI
jgi:hypothetical protein